MKFDRVKFKAFNLSSGNGCRRIKPHSPVGVVGCGAEVVSGPAVVSSELLYLVELLCLVELLYLLQLLY